VRKNSVSNRFIYSEKKTKRKIKKREHPGCPLTPPCRIPAKKSVQGEIKDNPDLSGYRHGEEKSGQP